MTSSPQQFDYCSRGVATCDVLGVRAGSVGDEQDEPRLGTAQDVNEASERFRPVKRKEHHWNIAGCCHDIELHAIYGEAEPSSPVPGNESEIMV
jgi:hypothetical protein